LGTGKHQRIEIKQASGLSTAEVDRMVRDAETYLEEDKAKRAFSQTMNDGEILLYSTEQTIKDFAEKFSKSDLADIKVAMENLRKVKSASNRNLDDLKMATQKLQTIMHRFAELMYSAPDAGRSNE
jgi:molecular chaperone DnaK